MPKPKEADANRPQLSMRYVRLADAVLWERNPKLHNLEAIIGSINRHGFRDAPIFDSSLNGIVAGNGRTLALRQMQQSGAEAPTGILVDNDGEWLLPIQFGVDAKSLAQAEAFGLDHNLLTASGAREKLSLVGLFEAQQLASVVRGTLAADIQIEGFSADDLVSILQGKNAESAGDTTSQLDGLVYSVVVECASEGAQAELIERMREEGYTCKPLIS